MEREDAAADFFTARLYLDATRARAERNGTSESGRMEAQEEDQQESIGRERKRHPSSGITV